MPGDRELPLRFYRLAAGGYVLRCLCGREITSVRRGVTKMTQLRAAISLPDLAADISLGGILIMVTHAERCDKWHKP